MARMLGPGAEVAGYRVLRELGRGGMGLVYEAEHLRLRRRAALKLLTPDLAGDESHRARFLQESRLIAAIDHPNIIPIYDAGEVDGNLYIAMRLVEGGDLAAAIEREGALGIERTLALIEQAAAALDAAHARGMVHRDVKPANVLLDDASAGRAFLTDFGIAKLTSPKTGAGMFVGSVDYAAPEQIEGAGTGSANRTDFGAAGLTSASSETSVGMFVGSVDYAAPEQIEGAAIGPATDVYALGCVLYECLTGRRPYPKGTNVAIIFGHLRDPPPRVTDERGDLPQGVDAVVSMALAKRPDERYQSCGELAAATRTALGGDDAGPSPQRSAPRAARPSSEPRATTPVVAPANPLVGRSAELTTLRALLADPDVRLVTLTGPGGAGKTRLALEALAGVEEQFPDGVAFVALETLSDAGLVLAAVAESLGAKEADLGSLARHLADEQLLLVLDNFEHVLAAAPLVSALVAAAPTAKVLVTSRAPLRIRAEREVPVPPLALPASGTPLAALAETPAVALFIDRAQAVKPDFELNAGNAETIAEICVRLDGLPLAIELAAARTRLFPPAALLSRLDSRFAVLTSGAQDLPSRHRTMRGTVEWSYDLLDEPARVLLTRLGVFSGGWTMDAAESVCSGPQELPAGVVVDWMSSLVDGSLVRTATGAAGESRYELLQIVQEFSVYLLIERGELEDVKRRHAEHYLALAEAAEPELLGAAQADWLTRLEDETGNLRAALRWSEESGEIELGLRIAGALPRFWSVRGLMAEISPWLARALESPAAVGPVRGKALFAAGHAALGQGHYADANARFDEGLGVYVGLEDEQGQAACLAQLGWLAGARGELNRAAILSRQCLAVAEGLGANGIVSVARATLADVAAHQGDYERAAEHLEQSLALRRQLGDRRNMANALLGLARIDFLRSEPEHAARRAEEGLELAREVGDTWSIALGTATLGLLALERGDLDEARSQLGRALELSWRRGDERIVAESLCALAAVAARAEDTVAAARRWGAAEALRTRIDASPSPTERALEERYLADLPQSMGAAAFEFERETGAALPPERAVDLALGI